MSPTSLIHTCCSPCVLQRYLSQQGPLGAGWYPPRRTAAAPLLATSADTPYRLARWQTHRRGLLQMMWEIALAARCQGGEQYRSAQLLTAGPGLHMAPRLCFRPIQILHIVPLASGNYSVTRQIPCALYGLHAISPPPPPPPHPDPNPTPPDL